MAQSGSSAGTAGATSSCRWRPTLPSARSTEPASPASRAAIQGTSRTMIRH